MHLAVGIRIIIIEFHNLHNLWNSEFFKIAESAFTKILQTHTCVHIHPNNFMGIYNLLGVEIPWLAEFTFIRNDRIEKLEYQTQFPHKLDYDNTTNESISLPRNWYKSS